MSTDINNASYSILNTYAVLASSGITTVNTTTITNGSYGSSPTATYVGTIVGTEDSGNAGTAQTELTALVGAINAVAVTSTISGGGGTITYTPGRYNSAATIVYNSGANIILDAEGNTSAQFFFTATSAITFTSVSSITLTNGASTCNVFWLAGSAISFDGTAPTGIPGIFIAGSAITFANASQISGRVYAQGANITFSGISSTSSVDATCTQSIVCYAKGTLILTKEGFVPIENIKRGDKVVTKGKIYKSDYLKNDDYAQIEPVVWISKFKVVNLNSASRPICIKRNALGSHQPFKDLYVSPGHSLLLNGKMYMAKNIVNGKTIYQDNECDNVEYYHLECEEHSAIFANGILAESYLESNNRDVFENIVEPSGISNNQSESPTPVIPVVKVSISNVSRYKSRGDFKKMHALR